MNPDVTGPPEPGRPFRIPYTSTRLLGDFFGGLMAALIALPYGLAMASLMGLPPVLGVYTCILGTPLIAIFGRNPVLIGGTSSVTVPFMAHAVAVGGMPRAALLAILGSLSMIAFGMARLGRAIMRVPMSVISGFSTGIGVLMLIGQMNVVLGIASTPGAAAMSPMQQFAAVAVHAGEARVAPVIVALIVIAVAFIVSRISPLLPSPLAGIIVAVVIARLAGLQVHEVGMLSASLPALQLAHAPALSEIWSLLPAALGLAFVVSANLLMSSRVVDNYRRSQLREKQPHNDARADADAELRAYGMANSFSGLFAAPPSVGVPARSMAVIKCGGTTALANLFHAAILILVLWFGAAIVARIPMSALGGVTDYIALGMLNVHTWRRLPRMRRRDAAAFLSTTLAMLFFNSVISLGVGCIAYYIARRIAASRISARRGTTKTALHSAEKIAEPLSR